MKILTKAEIKSVSGGPLPLVPLVIAAFAAGYTYGKDRAQRDNAREDDKTSNTCPAG